MSRNDSTSIVQGRYEQGAYRPSDTEMLITRAVIDVLLLRQEMSKHDISAGLRDDMMAAALPAFIAYEADRAKASP